MADDITNTMLLEHMQVMKSSLQQQITELDKRIQQQITGLDKKITLLAADMQQGFEDARQHRKALQEDLDATILMLGKHDRKLARL